MNNTNDQNILFWNVDTQYDFMRSDGKLYVPGAETIEGSLEKLTRYAASKNIKVISSGDWHTPDSAEFSDKPDYVNKFPQHCMQGTKGAEYVPATKPLDSYVVESDQKGIDKRKIAESRNIIIHKDAFDVFDTVKGNPHTESIVDMLNPSKVFVYGVATNYCVNYAVQGLAKRKNLEVYVVSDAIKEIPNEKLQETFDQWKALNVKMVSTEEVLKNIYHEDA